MVFLHFFGFGNTLRQFELEQFTGLTVAGFRPLVLDDLLVWSQHVADQHHWDVEHLQQTVIQSWMDRADQISTWQKQLTACPEDVALVAGLGSQGDWGRHWESMLRLS